MDLFSKTELIAMIAIVGVVLLIIIILTILDFIDERKSKKVINDELQEETNNQIKVSIDENVIKTEEVIEPNNFVEVEEIEILDFDEPVIEMKEELVNNAVDEIVFDEIEEISFESFVEETKNNVNENNIIEITNEKERAKEELRKLEVELEKEEDFSNTITNFELEQEENAIISYDELIKVSDKLYNQNEVIQYDDGNEPITIDEVIKRFSNSEMVFENTANLDKLNREIDNKEQNYIQVYDNE